MIFTDEVYHWKKPGVRNLFRENFGDYLARVVSNYIKRKNNLRKPKKNIRLVSIGSVLHHQKERSIIWGSGWNGKIDIKQAPVDVLFQHDYRALRGNLTKTFLTNLDIPLKGDLALGDPALLMPLFYTPVKNRKDTKPAWLPNMNEINRPYNKKNLQFISPFSKWSNVIDYLYSCQFVITSSLHGLILCEAYDIPVKFIMPNNSEAEFKYLDYFTGTGRKLTFNGKFYTDDEISTDVGVEPPKLEFDTQHLYNSFPFDLYE